MDGERDGLVRWDAEDSRVVFILELDVPKVEISKLPFWKGSE